MYCWINTKSSLRSVVYVYPAHSARYKYFGYHVENLSIKWRSRSSETSHLAQHQVTSSFIETSLQREMRYFSSALESFHWIGFQLISLKVRVKVCLRKELYPLALPGQGDCARNNDFYFLTIFQGTNCLSNSFLQYT